MSAILEKLKPASIPDLEWGDAIRIPTGNMDDPEKTELVMMWGGNGDLYIGTAPEGSKDWKMVHFVMSGGHNSAMPRVVADLSQAYFSAFNHFTIGEHP